MVDMNARMYRCCGVDVEVAGFTVKVGADRLGRRIHCSLCEDTFDVPGDLDDALRAIPEHFREVHDMEGPVEDWCRIDR